MERMETHGTQITGEGSRNRVLTLGNALIYDTGAAGPRELA